MSPDQPDAVLESYLLAKAGKVKYNIVIIQGKSVTRKSKAKAKKLKPVVKQQGIDSTNF